MKKLLLSLFAIVLALSYSTAQTISQDVISVAGSSVETSNGSLSWTIGESFVSTHQIQDKILTEGFHQPYLVECNINYFSKVTCVGSDEFIVEINTNDEKEYTILINDESTLFVGNTVLGPFSNNRSVDGSISGDKNGCFKTVKFENIDCNKQQAQIAGFVGEVAGEGNQLAWSIVNANTNNQVNISQSYDGVAFENLTSGNVNAIGNTTYDASSNAGLIYYRINVTNNGETIDEQTIQLSRIDELSSKTLTTKIFPNPVVDIANISFDKIIEIPNQEIIVSIYSINGELLRVDKLVLSNNLKLDMSEFRTAYYLLSIATTDGKLLSTNKVNKID